MPPAPGGKRKRQGSSYQDFSQEDSQQRPSPHRPQNLRTAQQHDSRSQQGQYNHHSPQQGWNDSRNRGSLRNRGGRNNHASPHQSNRNDARPATGPQSQQGGPNRNDAPDHRRPNTPSAMNSTPTRGVVQQANEARAREDTPEYSKVFYKYEHLTQELTDEWTEKGRAEIVEQGRTAVSTEDEIKLAILFGELLRAGLDKNIEPQAAGEAINDILTPSSEEQVGDARDAQDDTDGGDAFDARAIFVDCVALLPINDTKRSSFLRMMLATETSVSRLREVLDLELLVRLGLVRDNDIFRKTFIRYQTNVLYRQANFNLLREETEGFSKLVTELFTLSATGFSSTQTAIQSFKRITAIIGTFDLDVGRTLDVILDVFAALLVKQHRFFVKLLRHSTWWPQVSNNTAALLPHWVEESDDEDDGDQDQDMGVNKRYESHESVAFWEKVKHKGLSAWFELNGHELGSPTGTDSEAATSWQTVTGLASPSGNPEAAQILGFKLRFYASTARNTQDTLPINLIHLVALLIKIGFISLKDIYPHLWPEDEAMDQVKAQQVKEKEARDLALRPGGGKNALMMAGALTDDTIPAAVPARVKDLAATKQSGPSAPTPPKEADPSPDVSEINNQKVQLLRSLLAIGAIPEAMFMIGRFPWLIDLFPDMPSYIHRVINHCVDGLYSGPLTDTPGLDLTQAKNVVNVDQTNAAKGNVQHLEKPIPKTLRWPNIDSFDPSENIQYRFYWDSWAEHIPVCRTVDDLFSLCDSFLNLSGVKVGQDPSLMVKIVRIGMSSLKTDQSAANRQRWFDLAKRLLVPALSLVRHNSAVVNEVFSLLKLFSIGDRYKIYAEWYTGPTSRLPEISDAFSLATTETQDVMKRISKDNVRPMARALAKVATSSPGKVIEVVTKQMESYNNLIEVVIECTRYFTDLGYDVLTWFLTNALGAPSRSRVQSDGSSISKWLTALADFIGKVFARYQILSPNSILQILSHKIQLGDAGDLVVLQSLITNMVGVPTNVAMDESEIIACAFGPRLRALSLVRLEDKRHEKDKLRSTNRLLQALIEPNIVAPLLIGIAQARQKVIFGFAEKDAHTKLLSNAFDSHHRTLTQYLDLLRSTLSLADFDQHIPSVTSLIKDFGIDASIAFMIGRNSVAAQIDLDAKKAKSKSALLTMQDSVQRKDAVVGDAKQGDHDKTALVESETPNDANGVDAEKRYSTNASLYTLSRDLSPLLPGRVWDVLTESFYVFFWVRSLGDLSNPDPKRVYRDEIIRQEKESTKNVVARKGATTSELKAMAEQRKAIQDTIMSLQDEKEAQASANGLSLGQMRVEKDVWFANAANKVEELNCTLLEQCFLPRIMISQTDALYCFKLLKELHSMPAKNFRTLKFIDTVFDVKRLTWTIFMCSEAEVANLGLFLNELLNDLARWHSNGEIYKTDAIGKQNQLPGFATKLNEDVKTSEFLQFEDFRRLMQKWHSQLCTVFKSCFESPEYLRIRNGISLLISVQNHFPAIAWMGQSMVKAMEHLVKTNESRGDIQLAAKSAIAVLKKREKRWISPQAFSINKKLSALSSQTASKPSPAPVPNAKPLNASAKEFSPGQNKPPVGDSAKKPGDKIAPATIQNVQTDAGQSESQSQDKKGGDDATSGQPKPDTVKPDAADKKNSTQVVASGAAEQRSKEILPGPTKSEKHDSSKTPAESNESLNQSKQAPVSHESSTSTKQDLRQEPERPGRSVGSEQARYPPNQPHDSHHDSRDHGSRQDGRDFPHLSRRIGDSQYSDSRNGQNNAQGYQNQRHFGSTSHPESRSTFDHPDRARQIREMDPPSRPRGDRPAGRGQDGLRLDASSESGQGIANTREDRMRLRRDDFGEESRSHNVNDNGPPPARGPQSRQPSRLNTTQASAIPSADLPKPTDMSGVHPDRLASIQSPIAPDPSRLNSPHDRRQAGRDSVNQSPIIPKGTPGPQFGRVSGSVSTNPAGDRQSANSSLAPGPPPRQSERDDRRPVETLPESRQRQDRRFAEINGVLQPNSRPNAPQAIDNRTRTTRATAPIAPQAGYGRRDDQQGTESGLDTRSRPAPPPDPATRTRGPNGPNTSRPRSPERAPDRRQQPARSALRARTPSPPRPGRNDNALPPPLPGAAIGNRGVPPSGPTRDPYSSQSYGRDPRDRASREDERDRERAGPPRVDPRDRYDVGPGSGYNDGYSRGREGEYGRPAIHDDRGRQSGGWPTDRGPAHPRDDRGGYPPEEPSRYGNPRKRGPDDREREYVDQKRNRRGG